LLQAGPSPRLSLVGRERRDRPDDLPAPPPPRESESPAAVVLRALRASADGDRAALEPLLDVDALYARAKGAPGDEALQKASRQARLDTLVSNEWRRSGSVALSAKAASPGDLEEKIEGDRATVVARGARDPKPTFELARSGDRWRIVALPEK